jgi:integrase
LIARVEPVDGGASRRSTGDGRLPAAQLYRELKRLFAATADALQAEGARGAARVAQGSPHWLRHTFATHAIETVAPDVVGSVLGHASMATTTLYTRTELRRKARGLRDFGQRAGVSPPASRSRG